MVEPLAYKISLQTYHMFTPALNVPKISSFATQKGIQGHDAPRSRRKSSMHYVYT